MDFRGSKVHHDLKRRRKEQTVSEQIKRQKNLRESAKPKKRLHLREESDIVSNFGDKQSRQTFDLRSNGTKQRKCSSNAWVTIDDDNVIEGAPEIITILQQNISVQDVIADIQGKTSLLTDSSIELFLKIIEENSEFSHFNPTCYTGYSSPIEPCNESDRDMHIIGGNASRHWCCMLHAESTVMVYDSLCRCEYELIHEEEKRYIQRRYCRVGVENVVFMPVTRQPDCYSCWVYAAAFATIIALGHDPLGISYSRDPIAMRNHLTTIISSRKLSPFSTV